MAQLALAAAGAVAGAYIGGPAGASLGWTLGYTAGQLLFGPMGPKTEGPRIGEKRVQTSVYGQVIPLVYGSNRLAGNICWLMDNEIQEKKKAAGGGLIDLGKGGMSASTVTYSYTATFIVVLCEGPIAGIKKVWADTKLVFDAGADALAGAGSPMESGYQMDGFRMIVYLGTDDQDIDPDYEADVGTNNAPAFAGLACVKIHKLPLENFGNRIPQFSFEIVTDIDPAAKWYSFDDPGGGLVNAPVVDAARHQFATADNLTVHIRDPVLMNTVCITEDPPDNYNLFFAWNRAPISGDIFALYLYDISYVALHQYSSETGVSKSTTLGYTWDGVSYDMPTTFDLWIWQIGLAEYLGFSQSGTWVLFDVSGGVTPLVALRQVGLTYDVPGVLSPQRTACTPDGRLWFQDGSGSIIGCSWGGMGIEQTAYPQSPSDFYLCEFCGYDIINDLLVFSSTLAGTFVYDYWTDTLTECLNDAGTSLNGTIDAVLDGHAYGMGSASELLDVDLASRQSTLISLVDDLLPGTTLATPTSGFLFKQFNCAVVDRALFGWASVFLGRMDDIGCSVAAVIRDISRRVDLDLDLVDTSAVDHTLWGYPITRQLAGRGAILPLLTAYQLDAVEVDGLLRYVPRGVATPIAIEEDDLAAHGDGEEPGPLVDEIRQQEIELPERVTLTYIGRDGDYQQGAQYAKRSREVVDTVEQAKIELPLVLEDGEAANLAQVLLYAAWLERTSYNIQLPRAYARLAPADAITVPLAAGVSVRARVEEVDEGTDGLLKIKALGEGVAVYDPDAVAGDLAYATSTIAFTALSKLVLADIPTLRDSDAALDAFYWAALPLSGLSWPGAVVQKSTDGLAFAEWQSTIVGPDAGVAITALPAPRADQTWDRTNTLDVRWTHGNPPTSAAELDVLNGSNAALLGTPARGFEVVQFADVTDNGDGTYTLGTLLRGRRGSEFACATHAGGDALVMLSTSTMNVATGELGLERFYRAVTIGQTERLVDLITAFTFTGGTAKCLSPVHLAASRDGSNNLTITWTRRTRTGGAWRDLVDVPLGEETEAYSVDVLDGSGGAVLRTITSSTTSAAYSAADQTTDGLTPGDPVAIAVYQLSATVGRGWPGEAII